MIQPEVISEDPLSEADRTPPPKTQQAARSMSSASLLPAKRPRSEVAGGGGGGGGELRARLLEEQALWEEGPLADVALVGLMPEQVAAALQGNAQRPRRQREPVLAGVDARTARAYTYVDALL